MASGGHFLDTGIHHRGDDDLVALGETGEDGQQAFLDRGGVQAGEKDDQGAARRTAVEGGGQAVGVRFDEFGFEGRESVGQGGQEVSRRAALDAGPYPAVVGEEVDAVAGAGRQRGEQQRGVHGGVQARGVADAAGRGAAGLQGQEDVPVALRAPGADGDGLAAGGGAPVDGAGVVARGVVAEAVELGAFATGEDAGAAVEFAEPGQFSRQVFAAGEGRQDAHGPRDVVAALAGRETEGAVGADRDADGVVVAAAGGVERRRDAAALGRGDAYAVAGGCGFGAGGERAGRPGVAELRAERAPGRVGDGQVRTGFLAKSNGCFTGSGELELSHWRGEGQVAQNC